ncbi:hypothetical protein L596_017480 [Steinernema carpocapsae]|uniref:Uncharacterized protein n=1 Tax=Steinernema carpocapsae TaxID=34508 RepID=A0A4U5N1T7_STECR|nr:hypothetical protein L596_017480 [Steinernema carpocapsae]
MSAIEVEIIRTLPFCAIIDFANAEPKLHERLITVGLAPRRSLIQLSPPDPQTTSETNSSSELSIHTRNQR